MKKLRTLLLMLLCLLLALPAAAFAEEAGQELMFDIVTQVYDFGQRANAVRIDYGEGANIKAANLAPAMYEVRAVTTLADGTEVFNGRRSSTAAYVNNDGVYGHAEESGRYVFVELETPTERNSDGTVTNLGSETWLNGEKLTLNYSVTSYSEPNITFVQNGVYNYLVDEFEAGTIEADGKELNYRLYDPTTEFGTSDEGYPLVLFLHGEDERGTDNEKHLTTSKGATVWLEMDYANPCFVLAPQTNESWTDEDVDALVCALLDEVIATRNVDTDRIYVQGFSMGGVGTWNMLIKHSDYFAGGLPICGYVPAEYYDNDAAAFESIKMMPIWTFVVQNDDQQYVVGTEKAVEQLEAIADEGGATVKFEMWDVDSVLPPHNAWEQVYRIGTPYNFLMSQSRARTNDQTLNPKLMFTHYAYDDEITSVCDYDMNQLHVIDKGDTVYIIDSGTSPGDLYTYVIENVISNPDADIYSFITHNHGDHYKGLRWFADSEQIKGVYLHRAESAGTAESLGGDDTFHYVLDGDTVTIGEDTFEFHMIAGHTLNGTVIFYNDIMFTGDAVGSGDLFLSTTTVNVLERSLEEFIANMEDYKARKGYDTLYLLVGHKENKEQYTDSYIYDLYACAQGILDGTLSLSSYTRRAGSLYAGVNDAHIRMGDPATAVGAEGEVIFKILELVDEAENLDASLYTEESVQAFEEQYNYVITSAMLAADPSATEFDTSFIYLLKTEPAQEMLTALNDAMSLLVLK